MTVARFKEDTKAVTALEKQKKGIEDKIRMGESLLRAFIREAYKEEQPRLELPLPQEPPQKKEKEKEKKKPYDPYVDHNVDFFLEDLREVFLIDTINHGPI